ncbi:hypothetical protein M758_12G025300 [Ceratodon purpureus]|nr:hypothetical protein M758_12G025300 [Ceratodon purpureus]
MLKRSFQERDYLKTAVEEDRMLRERDEEEIWKKSKAIPSVSSVCAFHLVHTLFLANMVISWVWFYVRTIERDGMPKLKLQVKNLVMFQWNFVQSERSLNFLHVVRSSGAQSEELVVVSCYKREVAAYLLWILLLVQLHSWYVHSFLCAWPRHVSCHLFLLTVFFPAACTDCE